MCPAGTRAPVTGMSACFNCPALSDSVEGSASCSLDPDCLPCIDRSSLKVRAVLHGLRSDPFWKRMLRAMRTGATHMNVDFSASLQVRTSASEMNEAIEAAMLEEPDVLIVSLALENSFDAIKAASQKVQVFSVNAGAESAAKVGSLAHFGMHDFNAGSATVEPFREVFSSSGITLTSCAAVNFEADNIAMTERVQGLQQACLQQNLTWLGVTVVDVSSSSGQQAAVAAFISSHQSTSTSTEGLGIVILGESIFPASLAAWEAAGQPVNVKLGLFDLAAGIDDGIRSGAVAFGVDQNSWLQGYLPIVIATMYMTTGNLMAAELYDTGPIFLTEPRDSEVAQRKLEGSPICDCPWVGGQEAYLECGPDVEGIEAIGECPLASGECTSPCLDIRKFVARGALLGTEQDTFWFVVKAGGEQAANDLRLMDFDSDMFGPTGLGTDDAYSDERYEALIREWAEDDSIDGFYFSLKGQWLNASAGYVASKKPVMNINTGIPEDSEALGLLHFVGQDDTQAGYIAGKALANLGVQHIGCMMMDYAHSGFLGRCTGAEQAATEAGIEFTWVPLFEYGGSYSSDASIRSAVKTGLELNPTIDTILSLGSSFATPAYEAWLEDGRSADDFVGGTFDVDETSIASIEEGTLRFTIDQQAYMQGYMGVMALAIYHMSGEKLTEHMISSGPILRQAAKPKGDACLATKWGAYAEGTTDPLVGERFLPLHEADLITGYPVCERAGSCESEGMYFDTSTAKCRPCQAGTFSNSSMVSCMPCPAGTSTGGQAGSASCTACGEGLYSLEGNASCSYCAVGTFSSVTGASECEACRAPFTTEQIASNSQESCLCPASMYGVAGNYSSGGKCESCPEAMTCAFGSHEEYGAGTWVVAKGFPQVNPGYMTLSTAPLVPYKCGTEDACPGGSTASCSEGRMTSEVACAVCEDGHFLADNECQACNGVFSLSLVVTIVGGLFCLGLATIFANTGSHMRSQSSFIVVIMASLMFTNFQALTVFESLSFTWFSPMSELLSMTSVLSINVQLLRFSCVMQLSTAAKYGLLQLAVPCSVPFCLVVVLLKKYCPIKRLRVPKTSVATEVVTSVGSLMGMFFISVMMSCVSPFVCYGHPGAAGSSVLDAPEILCTWSDEHMQMGIFSTISLLLVPIPFLANTVLVTYRYSKSMGLEARREVLYKYRFLFFRFHPHAYYYGLVLVVRSLMICLVPVLIRDDPGLQIFTLATIVVAFAEYQCTLQPWRASICNRVDALLGLLLLCLLVCAPMASGIQADKTPLKILGIAALASMAVLGIFTFAMAALKHFRRDPWYDIFLCHHKERAAAQVRYIKTLITASSTQSVFIDSDNLVNLDGLFDIVKCHVGVFCAYLTNATLTRAWCCGEVVSAFAAKLQVITVKTQSFVPPTIEQLDNLSSYIHGLDSTLSHYGISTKAVRNGLESLLKPDVQSFHVNPDLLHGTARCLFVARSLLKQRYDPGTPDKEFAIAISASSDDDEALAAAGYIKAGLTKHLQDSFGEGKVLVLPDHPWGSSSRSSAMLAHSSTSSTAGSTSPSAWMSELSTDGQEAKRLASVDERFAGARAVVILLSAATLQCPRELVRIADLVDISSEREDTGEPMELIPVHLPDFHFPTKSFFEVELLRIIHKEDARRIAGRLKICFKRISVQMPVYASEEVLQSQVSAMFARVPSHGRQTKARQGSPSKWRKYLGQQPVITPSGEHLHRLSPEVCGEDIVIKHEEDNGCFTLAV